ERIGAACGELAPDHFHGLLGHLAPTHTDAEAAHELRLHGIGEHRDLAAALRAREDGGHRAVARELPLREAHHLVAADAQELHVPTPFASTCTIWPASTCSARAAANSSPPRPTGSPRSVARAMRGSKGISAQSGTPVDAASRRAPSAANSNALWPQLSQT